MNCQEGMELMQRYVDYDLNEEETARLMEHVGQCPDCAAMFQRLVRLSRGLEQLPRVAPPYSLVDAILPKLENIRPEPGDAGSAAQPDRADAAGRAMNRRRSGHRNYRSWIGRIAGVAALGAVIGLLILNRPEADPLAGNQKIASMPGSANSSGQAAMEKSAADAGLFATPTMGGSGASPADGIAKELAGGLSSQESVLAEGQSFAGQPPAAQDQYGITGNMPAPVEEPAAEAPNLREKGKDEAPPAENPPEEEPSGVLLGKGSSMSIMDFPSVPEEEAVSPDGQWRAVITDGMLQLYRMSDDALVYDQAPDPCVRGGLVWSDDSSEVLYTCTDADGNEIPLALRIEATSFTEYKR